MILDGVSDLCLWIYGIFSLRCPKESSDSVQNFGILICIDTSNLTGLWGPTGSGKTMVCNYKLFNDQNFAEQRRLDAERQTELMKIQIAYEVQLELLRNERDTARRTLEGGGPCTTQ